MKINIGQAVAPIQGQLNQFSQNNQFNSILKGLTGGFTGALSADVKQQQANKLTEALESQKRTIKGRLGQYEGMGIPGAELSEIDRMALEDQLNRLDVLQSGIGLDNLGDVMKMYQGQYSPIGDTKSLENALKVAHITGDYRVAAAGQIAQGMAGKLDLENRKFENEQEKEANKNAAINRIQKGAGSLPTLLNPIMNQFTNFSGLGSLNADSSMYGY